MYDKLYLAKLLAGLIGLLLPQAHQHLVRKAAMIAVRVRVIPLGEAVLLVDEDFGSPQRAHPRIAVRHGPPPLGQDLQLLDCNETAENPIFRGLTHVTGLRPLV